MIFAIVPHRRLVKKEKRKKNYFQRNMSKSFGGSHITQVEEKKGHKPDGGDQWRTAGHGLGASISNHVKKLPEGYESYLNMFADDDKIMREITGIQDRDNL